LRPAIAVGISNHRLVAADDGSVSVRWKDYRIEGPGRWKTMAIAPQEFIRRFLMHALPKGFGGDLPTFLFRSHRCDGPYIPI
jgi:hypothetical protein